MRIDFIRADAEHAERKKDNDKSVPMADVEAAPAADAQEEVKSPEATPQEPEDDEKPAPTNAADPTPANEAEDDSKPVDNTTTASETQGPEQSVEAQAGENGEKVEAEASGDAVQQPAAESTEVEMSG